MKRTPLARKTPLKQGKGLTTRKPLESRSQLTSKTRVKPRSQKRIDEKPERDAVREATLRRAGFRCEAGDGAFGMPCFGDLAAHEVIKRSVRPGSHLEVELTAAVCVAHHAALDEAKHRPEARRRRLFFDSWEYAEAIRPA